MRNQLLRLGRALLNPFGVDVVRFEPRRWTPVRWFLNAHQIDLVYDVGGNIGQFARYLRSLGYEGDIYSVEPNPEAFEEMRRSMSGDSRWRGDCVGFGSRAMRTEMNVTKASVFSSLLDPTDYITGLCDTARVTKRVPIEVTTLDAVFEREGHSGRRIYLKIDT